MERILDVAAYIARQYKTLTGDTLDEMKLHKLLYYTQRESFAILDEPAFAGELEGWKYGPVSREIRSEYYNGEILSPTHEISDQAAYIANNVILEYGALASWKLSQLSHQDSAWKNARKGLDPNENGSVPLRLEDIREDAKKVRPYDHVWDMYYDEFEDCPVEEGGLV